MRRPIIGWMNDLEALTPADVREFYLGLAVGAGHTSRKDVKHYKRRKRWLS